MDGLLIANPYNITPILPHGDVSIDEFVADGKSLNIDSLHLQTLTPNTKEIEIKLAFSALCNLENIYIEYQLNDTLKWIKLGNGNETSIKFNNLDPGEYNLKIRKLNGFGINNYSYKNIQFKIKTPWYKTWWFMLVSIFVFLGIIYSFTEWRTKNLKQKQINLEQKINQKTLELQKQNEILEKNNNIKSRLISIISHDIVTPLKFLTVTGKKLVEKRAVMPDAVQEETIKEMANTSQELHLLSTNILNWIKYQNENRRLTKEQLNVFELTNQVIGVLKSIAKQKGLTISNKIDQETSIFQYYEPLKILIYNLISNAINFSEKGVISVVSEFDKNDLIITVIDEGVGLSDDQIKNIMADQFIISSANVDNKKGNGLGYLIIKDLLKIMGAQLSIESKKGIGTKIHIKIAVK